MLGNTDYPNHSRLRETKPQWFCWGDVILPPCYWNSKWFYLYRNQKMVITYWIRKFFIPPLNSLSAMKRDKEKKCVLGVSPSLKLQILNVLPFIFQSLQAIALPQSSERPTGVQDREDREPQPIYPERQSQKSSLTFTEPAEECGSLQLSSTWSWEMKFAPCTPAFLISSFQILIFCYLWESPTSHSEDTAVSQFSVALALIWKHSTDL